jgi:hypothetical protein
MTEENGGSETGDDNVQSCVTRKRDVLSLLPLVAILALLCHDGGFKKDCRPVNSVVNTSAQVLQVFQDLGTRLLVQSNRDLSNG